MLAIADAQQARSERRPADALKLLESVDSGNALLEVVALRMELLAELGRTAEAIEVAETLAAARGRAYVEYGTLYSRSLRNVVVSNLVHLRLAELNAGLRVFKGRPRPTIVQGYGEEFAKALEESPTGQWRALPTHETWRAVLVESVAPPQPASDP